MAGFGQDLEWTMAEVAERTDDWETDGVIR